MAHHCRPLSLGEEARSLSSANVPTVPEVHAMNHIMIWARIWARTVFIYVYEAPGIQPSRLWQPGSMGLVSLSRALVPR